MLSAPWKAHWHDPTSWAWGWRRAPYHEKLKQTEAEYDELKSLYEEDHPKIQELTEEIHRLKTKINAIPFIDTFDLRYNNRVKEPSPTTRAVMFCLMDVSGSMNEERKDIAKRFFILLYLINLEIVSNNWLYYV